MNDFVASVVAAWLLVGCAFQAASPEVAKTASATKAKEGGNMEHAQDHLETKRLVIRRFTPEDWADFQELGKDWSKSPAPDWDKWPTSEEASKGSVNYMSTSDKYFAVCLRDTKKLIGLLALNDQTDEERAKKQLDLGHVIHSRYQDNDHDKEALKAMIDHVFKSKGMLSIVTHNPSDFAEQLAPLKSLGLSPLKDRGELGITKEEWVQRRKEEEKVSR
ncbi:MAG: GNAT family N-acetyltransferase [Armatimonadetes bacterium]|nr:GNAT family N-acetyltransferase [Armatimonadota bacterium]